jgi:hypothetical protein
MSDAPKPPEATPALATPEDVRAAWDRFRSGGSVACAGDGGMVALSVDASSGVYRLVCTSCGLASPWFESGPGGLRLRGQSQPSLPVRAATPED